MGDVVKILVVLSLPVGLYLTSSAWLPILTDVMSYLPSF